MKVARIVVFGLALVAFGCSSSDGEGRSVVDASSSTGTDGTDAGSFADGTDGSTGATGTAGTEGTSGAPSTTGDDGATTAADGFDSAEGFDGADGADGATGFTGATGSTGGAGGTGGGAGTGSCADIFTCANACGEANYEVCFQGCLDAATPEAKANFDSLLACISTACPDSSDSCIEGAFTGACAPQANACVGGGGGGTTGGTTGGGGAGSPSSCSGALQCAGACADQACAQACLAALDAESGALWNALAGCISTECPANDNQCIQAAVQGACAAAFQACSGDSAGKPGMYVAHGHWFRAYTLDYIMVSILRDLIIQ